MIAAHFESTPSFLTADLYSIMYVTTCVGVCVCWVLQCVGVCMYGFCNVWVCVCMGFVMCECVYVWVLYCHDVRLASLTKGQGLYGNNGVLTTEIIRRRILRLLRDLWLSRLLLCAPGGVLFLRGYFSSPICILLTNPLAFHSAFGIAALSLPSEHSTSALPSFHALFLPLPSPSFHCFEHLCLPLLCTAGVTGRGEQ